MFLIALIILVLAITFTLFLIVSREEELTDKEIADYTGIKIDAVYANPIFSAEIMGHRLILQEPSDLTYMFTLPRVYHDMIINYIEKSEHVPVPSSIELVVSPIGSTGCITAFYYAIQKILKRTITVKSNISPPFYFLHKFLTTTLPNCEWSETGFIDIEVIVSPNNPDGRITAPTGTSIYVILDSVYDKEIFSGTPNTVNPWKYKYRESPNFCEVSSFSKSGLAGTRVGYALTANKQIAAEMREYFNNATLGLTSSAMKVLLSNMDTLMDTKIKQKIYVKNQRRQNEIRAVIPKELIRSERNIPFLFVRAPIRLFDNVGIIVRPGENFETSNDFVRINMMIGDREWRIMIKRLSRIKWN